VGGGAENKRFARLQDNNLVVSGARWAIRNPITDSQVLILWQDLIRGRLPGAAIAGRHKKGPEVLLFDTIPPPVDVPSGAMISDLDKPWPNARRISVDIDPVR
jgi:hypothetical protein